jgi:hypothetical protein
LLTTSSLRANNLGTCRSDDICKGVEHGDDGEIPGRTRCPALDVHPPRRRLAHALGGHAARVPALLIGRDRHDDSNDGRLRISAMQTEV